MFKHQSCKAWTGSELNGEKGPYCCACDIPQKKLLARVTTSRCTMYRLQGNTLMSSRSQRSCGFHDYISLFPLVGLLHLEYNSLPIASPSCSEVESDDALVVWLSHCWTTSWHRKSDRSTSDNWVNEQLSQSECKSSLSDFSGVYKTWSLSFSVTCSVPKVPMQWST